MHSLPLFPTPYPLSPTLYPYYHIKTIHILFLPLKPGDTISSLRAQRHCSPRDVGPRSLRSHTQATGTPTQAGDGGVLRGGVFRHYQRYTA